MGCPQLSSPLIFIEQVLARLKKAVLAGPGRGRGGRRLGLHLQVVEIGFAERALDDFDMKREVRCQIGVECFEQITA